jgi:anti-sigma factor RsiW
VTDEERKDHPEAGRLMALLDGELSGPTADRLEEHLEACESCRRRRDELVRASELLSRELEDRDVEVPAADALAVRRVAHYRAAERGRADPAPGDGERRGRSDAGKHGGGRLARSALWKAAVLVLGVGAVASAAVPGSPVEGWIGDAVQALASSFSGEPAPADSAAADAAGRPAAPQGVSVPVSDRAVVRITDAAPGLRVHVRPVEDSLLSVFARGARYRAGDGTIEVLGADRPDLRIELPTGPGTARIMADEVLLLERVDGRLRVRAASADTVDGTISFPVDGGEG